MPRLDFHPEAARAINVRLQPNITKRDGSYIYRAQVLSAGDIAGARAMYGPKVYATHQCTGYLAQCQFTAYASMELPPYTYEWHFSDSPVAKYGPSVDHTFSSYGNQAAEVVVRDAKGQYTYTMVNVYLDPNSTCEICE